MTITVEGTYTSTSVKVLTSVISAVTIPPDAVVYVFLSHHQKTANGGKFCDVVTWNITEYFDLIGREEYNEEVVEIWRIINPTPDTLAITVNWVSSQACWDGSCQAAVVLSGVDQDTPDDGFVSNSLSFNVATLNIPTIVGDLCYGVLSSDNNDPTENGNGTSQWNLTNDLCYGDGVSYTSSDTETNFSYDQGISADWAFAGISINPAAAGCVPQTDSRIADDTVSWQAACDGDIADWVKTNEFILSTWAIGGDDGNKSFKLQWKESGGSFVDVGADTEIKYGTGTSLVDGDDVGTSAACLSSTVSEENEGDNAAQLDVMGSSDVGEIQWALGFGSGAQDGVTYEFQLVNISDTLQEICSCSITTFSIGGYTIGINRGINRGVL
jgi:hypothetical protein